MAGLRERGYEIDVFVDLRASDAPDGVWSAHDFVWRQARHPHHVVVYQFGNSSHHDYIWPYALRYPGLVVLHDTRLHHARAALLLRERRAADYRAELSWSHPDLNPDLAELAIAGFDSALYYDWPMLRPLVARRASWLSTAPAPPIRSPRRFPARACDRFAWAKANRCRSSSGPTPVAASASAME